jgi:hypothetical protein
VDRPPAALLLAYRLLGWRLGPSHRDWVRDDLTRRGWLLRAGLPVLAVVYAVGFLVDLALGGDPARLLALLVVLAGGAAFLRHGLQERALRQQGLRPDGTPLTSWYDDDRARRALNLRGAVATVVLVGAALVLLALRSR